MTVERTIYILGAGSMGSLVAYELASTDPTLNIVLLFRSEEKVQRFEQNGSKVTIYRAPDNETVSVSVKASCPSSMAKSGHKILNLIVSTKTYQTKSALVDYISLLSPSSDILFIQNGLGVLDILHKEVWPVKELRPNLYQGVTNHGGFKTPNTDDEFKFTHAGYGDLKIAQIPIGRDSMLSPSPEKSSMISALLKPVFLNTVLYEYSDLLVVQVEKFAVNACINSITSIVDCINGELKPLENTEELFRGVISELLEVFFHTMPVLTANKSASTILNLDRLVAHVIDVGTVINAKNSSSMRQDTLHLRTTEIDFINGYVVTLAEASGMKADVNKTITLLVKTRLALNRARNLQIEQEMI